MAIPKTKERREKRLKDQWKKFMQNPEMQKRIEGRIAALKGEKR